MRNSGLPPTEPHSTQPPPGSTAQPSCPRLLEGGGGSHEPLLPAAAQGLDFLPRNTAELSEREKKLVSGLRHRSVAGQVQSHQRRRFLTLLATALHAYGSSAARTEYLVEQAATSLGEETTVAVFPTLVLLSFGEGPDETCGRKTVLQRVEQALDVSKLGRVDELAQAVAADKHLVLAAYWHLRAIANTPDNFGTLPRLGAQLLKAAAAAPLFFGGSLPDALLAGLLGLAGALLKLLTARVSPVAHSTVEFLCGALAAFAARVTLALVASDLLCFYPVVLGALVSFLPGLDLMLGVDELVGKSFVAGTAHVTGAIFRAFQLGFGVAMGHALVFWDTATVPSTLCSHPAPLPISWTKLAWFLVYVLGSNVSRDARLDQWPGMYVVSAIGYLVSRLALPLGREARSILAAFAVSISGTLYSRVWNHYPLAMKTSAILLLIPGGIGVSGVVELLHDKSSGTVFVFEMLSVTLAVTFGLLLGKMVFPEAAFGYARQKRVDKHKIGQVMREDSLFGDVDEA